MGYYDRLNEKYDIGNEVKKIQDSIKSNNDQGGGFYTENAEELNTWNENRNKIFAGRMMDDDMLLSNYLKREKKIRDKIGKMILKNYLDAVNFLTTMMMLMMIAIKRETTIRLVEKNTKME